MSGLRQYKSCISSPPVVFVKIPLSMPVTISLQRAFVLETWIVWNPFIITWGHMEQLNLVFHLTSIPWFESSVDCFPIWCESKRTKFPFSKIIQIIVFPWGQVKFRHFPKKSSCIFDIPIEFVLKIIVMAIYLMARDKTPQNCRIFELAQPTG